MASKDRVVAGSGVGAASDALPAIGPALVALVHEEFDIGDELVDNGSIDPSDEDSGECVFVLKILLRLVHPVHLVGLLSCGAGLSVLFGKVVEDGNALVLLFSIRLDVGWERATRGGVGAGRLGHLPFLTSNADILEVDTTVGKEVADRLRASLNVEVDEFGFSSVGHGIFRLI